MAFKMKGFSGFKHIKGTKHNEIHGPGHKDHSRSRKVSINPMTEKERKEFIGRTAMKKKGTVAKGKQQVYKKEIKQLEAKLDKLFPNYDQNEAEITKTYKRINDLRDKMAGHRIGERPTPGDKDMSE